VEGGREKRKKEGPTILNQLSYRIGDAWVRRRPKEAKEIKLPPIVSILLRIFASSGDGKGEGEKKNSGEEEGGGRGGKEERVLTGPESFSVSFDVARRREGGGRGSGERE